MTALLALARKDLRLLVRDRVALFFTFVFPLVVAVFFGMVFGGGGGGPARKMNIAVVDEDASPASRSFVNDLQSGAEFTVAVVPTRDEARAQVLAGRRVAYVRIPVGYGAARGDLLTTFGPSAAKPTLEVGVDPGRTAERGMIQGIMQKYAFQTMGTMFTDPARMRPMLASGLKNLQQRQEWDPGLRERLGGVFQSLDSFMTRLDTVKEAGDAGGGAGAASAGPDPGGFAPVKIDFLDVAPPDTGPPNAFAITFPQGIIWGIIGSALGFGISLVVERQRGTLARLRASPLPAWMILLGKALACFLTICAVSAALLLLANLAFKVPIAKPVHMIAAVFSVAVAFLGIMMLCACAGRTEASASGVAWGVMVILAFIGGAAMPLMFMPAWVDPLSTLSPVKWSILALEAAIWRPVTTARMAMICGILIAIGVVGFLIGATIFTRQRD